MSAKTADKTEATSSRGAASESRSDTSQSQQVPQDHETAMFHFTFGLSCAEEARKFDPKTQSKERSEYFSEALEYLRSSLGTMPQNHSIHFAIGLIEAENARFERSMESFRKALTLHPKAAAEVMPLLAVVTEEVAKSSDTLRTISPEIMAVQGHLLQGDHATALSTSVAVVNRFLQHGGELDLWSVQLMRIAAIGSNKEAVLASYIPKLEERGVLSSNDTSYHPQSFSLTNERRQDILNEEETRGTTPQRSRVWKELEQREENVRPINNTAASVGPKARLKE